MDANIRSNRRKTINLMVKVNKQKEQTPTTECDPEERVTGFEEVVYGYTREEAMNEAARCLQCPDAPCMMGCPVAVPIPQFIEKIAEGDFATAYALIRSRNILPAVTARVCAQETQCEGVCTRGKNGDPVAIGQLQRFATDWAYENPEPAKEALEKLMKELGETEPKYHLVDKKVAVIGSGPASLSCAAELNDNGVQVTVFEALHKAGGILTYGIPEFRLPRELAEKEVLFVEKSGVDFKYDTFIGQDFNLNDLFDKEGYDAIFIGTGSGKAKHLGIEGEDLKGVSVANDLLRQINLLEGDKTLGSNTPLYSGKKCAVVGGGNVAMDAARIIRRLGAEVSIVYRREREQMPARAEEVRHAEEEGVTLKMLTSPVRVLGNEEGQVIGLECVRMELGDPDDSGRRRPQAIDGSNFIIGIDMLVVAVGSKVDSQIANATPGLETEKDNLIVIDKVTGATAVPGVFAGGDNVIGPATVIAAMDAGKQAAQGIISYLRQS